MDEWFDLADDCEDDLPADEAAERALWADMMDEANAIAAFASIDSDTMPFDGDETPF